MDITERFINYTRFDTQSAEDSDSVPSTAKQLVFAQYLKKELEDEGLDDVELDEKGYLYATLKANIKDEVPTIGFIAHYDTSPDCSGANVNARIIKDDHGDDTIVTDGTTLLGADDKAGIAEIVEAMVYLKAHPDIKHGKIRIAFNPDEEIGRGAEHFNVERFGCQWAYTMDGGELGELEYENFNAAQAKITVKGFNVHPGYAKDRMRNANRIAMQLAAMLPQEETPEATEGYQGFYHLTAMTGTVEEAHLSYILRDHDRSRFDDRKRMMERCCETINAQYGEGTATLVMRDQYYNMREQLEPDNMHVIDVVLKAMQECGISPKVKPIRGGTDGAQLSFRGLPCPNIFAGSEMMHSTEEHVSVATMQKAKELIIKICQHVGSFNS